MSDETEVRRETGPVRASSGAPGPRRDPGVAQPAESPADAAARAVLQAIGDRARQTNLRRVRELDEALRTAGRGDLDGDGWDAATAVAHQLVGSVGTFGYRRASDRARELEHLFRDRVSDPEALGAATEGLAGIERELEAGQATLE